MELDLPSGFPTRVFVEEAPSAGLLPDSAWTLLGDEAVRGSWRDAGLPEPPVTLWVEVSEQAKRLGTLEQNPQNWEKNTVINMVDLLKGGSLKIIFDCGVDDFFYTVNQNLHQKLLENKIPHDYIQRPGEHNWDYWRNSIKYQALYFSDFFKTAAIK